ncbi:AIPR family protein [Flavobacterium filum]|uniref:AIPR family protein n=1 Tax=Flavobacterium filum TaxID=370974 RepID=UPI0023EFB1B0|nr:AIPR family protein [Flavobacterium filum]
MIWKESFIQEIEDIAAKKSIKPYRAFIYWYLMSSEGLQPEMIEDMIVDGAKDGGCDALVIDYELKVIKIIQSKYTSEFGKTAFGKDELLKLKKIYDYLTGKSNFNLLRNYVKEKLKNKLDKAVNLVCEDGYKIRLIFVTNHKKNVNSKVYNDEKDIKIEIVSYEELRSKYEEWIHGHSPELGEVTLQFQSILTGPTLPKAYIANIHSKHLKKIYSKFKEKLFSRNVRIFYENSKPNKAIKVTLNKDSGNFWAFNNGITILAETVEIDNKENEMLLTNPQIINGCQTVTLIGENPESEAMLFSKVIEIKDSLLNQKFIDNIIEANNRQNPVGERILKSNHPLQVMLQRKLEYFDYYFERKKGQYKKEANRSAKVASLKKIDNKELVQTNLAAYRQPHMVFDNENDLFSIRFGDVFKEDKTPFEYLFPYIIWKQIAKFAKKHRRNQNRSQFNKLASYHILKQIYDFYPVFSQRLRLHDLFLIFRQNDFEIYEAPLKKYFDNAFVMYKDSDYYGENSGQRDFFRDKDTYDYLKKILTNKDLKGLFPKGLLK